MLALKMNLAHGSNKRSSSYADERSIPRVKRELQSIAGPYRLEFPSLFPRRAHRRAGGRALEAIF